jgi:hypothetical protein
MTIPSSTPIRVMIVDDHQMVRRGLGTFLKVFDDLELVGEADKGRNSNPTMRETPARCCTHGHGYVRDGRRDCNTADP